MAGRAVMHLAISTEAEARLLPAAVRAGYCMDDAHKATEEGRMAIWTHGGMTVTTEVDEDNVCDIRLGGGKLRIEDVRALEREITEAPCHSSVVKYRIWGRRGWQRVFPHWDYCGMEDGLAVLELDT